MGFTHYYSQKKWTKKDKDGFKRAIPYIEHIVKEHQDILCWESNQPDLPPLVHEAQIRFNGVGEEGHETFVVFNIQEDHSNFCKTERKPYDLPVCKVLAVLNHFCPNFEITSDGNIVPVKDGYPDSWPEAHQWCAENLKDYKVPALEQ